MAESKTKGKKIGMNTNDKDKRLTVRLNAEELEYLESNADMLGITPSALLRQVIHVSMRATAQATAQAKSTVVKTADDVAKASDKNVSRETKKRTNSTAKKTAKKE